MESQRVRSAGPARGVSARACEAARLPLCHAAICRTLTPRPFTNHELAERKRLTADTGGDEMNFDLEDSLAILERTPATLAAMLASAPPAWIAANEGPDTWSAFDVVGHLVHGEETDWIPRARRIMESGESLAFDPFDRFAMFEASRGKTIGALLEAFAERRARSLAVLRGWRLSPADLERRGTHPAFGAVTMRELLATWVVHDLGHIAQIARVMAKRYAADVGPWVEYLPVLTRR